jgi:hypothetical protein
MRLIRDVAKDGSERCFFILVPPDKLRRMDFFTDSPGDTTGDTGGESIVASDRVDASSVSVLRIFLIATKHSAFGGATINVPNPTAIDPIEAIRLPAVPERGSYGPSLASRAQYEHLSLIRL